MVPTAPALPPPSFALLSTEKRFGDRRLPTETPPSTEKRVGDRRSPT
jgi:hypothetical protein